jgi:hypothetical protein
MILVQLWLDEQADNGADKAGYAAADSFLEAILIGLT